MIHIYNVIRRHKKTLIMIKINREIILFFVEGVKNSCSGTKYFAKNLIILGKLLKLENGCGKTVYQIKILIFVMDTNKFYELNILAGFQFN